MKPTFATGAAALVLCLASAPVALAAPDGPVAPIRAFVKAIDTGDMTAAAATHEGSVAIIDEMPPFAWTGPTAFADWLAAFGADSKARDQTDTRATLGAPIRVQTDGAAAYAVYHVNLDFKEHGVAMHEPAVWTFVLDQTPAGWKIKSWAWGGHKPAPAKAAVPPAPAAAAK